MRVQRGDRLRAFNNIGSSAAGVGILDYDGVIAPVEADPANAISEPRTLEAMGRWTNEQDAMAVLSARYADDLHRRVPVAGIHLAGAYGRERRDPDGTMHIDADEQDSVTIVRQAMEASRDRLEANGLLSDLVRIDERRWTFAVDYRPLRSAIASASGNERAQLQRAYDRVATEVPALLSSATGGFPGLIIQPGRSVLEVGGQGWDKRHAARRIFEHVLPAGVPARVMVIGDDLRDEPMFDAVDDFERSPRQTIFGLRVLVDNPEAPERFRARADVLLDGPHELPQFLDQTNRSLQASPERTL